LFLPCFWASLGPGRLPWDSCCGDVECARVVGPVAASFVSEFNFWNLVKKVLKVAPNKTRYFVSVPNWFILVAHGLSKLPGLGPDPGPNVGPGPCFVSPWTKYEPSWGWWQNLVSFG